MSDENDLQLNISADASAVAPGVEATQDQMDVLISAVQGLTSQFAELSAQMAESMAQGAENTSEMVAEMKVLEEETEAEAVSLRELAAGAREGLESLVEMREAVMGMGEVFLAAFAVERIADWAKEFAESSEKVEHLGQQFGMTTNEVQQLGTVAQAAGVGLDTITRGMQILDRNAVNAAEGTSAAANAFKVVGVSANDGASNMERLSTIADKFHDMADGPNKAALAMELFGRSGTQLIPILNLGAEGIEKLKEKGEEYDASNTAVSQSAQQKGQQLAESINELGIAWTGVTNILGDAFGPVLTEIVDGMENLIKEFVDSYNAGGTVAVVFQTISSVIEVAGGIINAFAAVFETLWETVSTVLGAIASAFVEVFGGQLPRSSKDGQVALNEILDAIVLLKDGWIATIQTIEAGMIGLIDVVKAGALVVYDALTGNWSAVVADWNKGFSDIEREGQEWAAKMKATAADVAKTISNASQGIGPSSGDHGVETSEGGAGGDFNPDLGKTPKEKKPKDDLVQQLDEQLKEKEVAWQMQQAAQGTAQEYSLQSISDYWQDALSRDDLSQKDRLAIEEKYLEASKQLTAENIQQDLDGYRAKLDATKQGSQQRIEILTEEAAFVGRIYGEDSEQYRRAQLQIVSARRDAAEQTRQIAEQAAEAEAKLQAMDIADQESAAKFRVSMGAETNAQELQEQEVFENEKYQIALQGLQKRLSIVDPNADPAQYAKLTEQIEALERTHQATMTSIAQQATLQRTAIERTAISSTSSLFGENIAKMATLQQGFGATVRSVYTGMVNIAATAMAKMIEQWISQQLSALLLKHTSQAAEAAATVTSNAAVAASAAFASTAAIPIVGPELAPAAAAAAEAATLAFLPQASAAGGWGQVPYDGAVTELHKDEMVLPSSIATPLRAALEMGSNLSLGRTGMAVAGLASQADGTGSPQQQTRSEGDIHVHLSAIDTQSGMQFINRNRTTIAKSVRQAVREGVR